MIFTPIGANPEKKKPTLKELMTGRVLNGYIEAARVKPLNEFFTLDDARKELREKFDKLEVLEAVKKGGVGEWLGKPITPGWARREALEKRFGKEIIHELLREGKIYSPRPSLIILTEGD